MSEKATVDRKKVATITVAWNSYPNEDMDDDDGPDEGWYVDVDLGKRGGGSIGPDFYGPGYKTLDEAIASVRKWAADRKLLVETMSFYLSVFSEGGDDTDG